MANVSDKFWQSEQLILELTWLGQQLKWTWAEEKENVEKTMSQ